MSQKPIHTEVIKSDAIIPLEINAHFYKRVQDMLLRMIDEQKPEDAKAAVDKIKAGIKDLSPWETNLETVLILISSIEESARISGMTTTQQIDAQPT